MRRLTKPQLAVLQIASDSYPTPVRGSNRTDGAAGIVSVAVADRLEERGFLVASGWDGRVMTYRLTSLGRRAVAATR